MTKRHLTEQQREEIRAKYKTYLEYQKKVKAASGRTAADEIRKEAKPFRPSSLADEYNVTRRNIHHIIKDLQNSEE